MNADTCEKCTESLLSARRRNKYVFEEDKLKNSSRVRMEVDNPRNSSGAVWVDNSRYSFWVAKEDSLRSSSGATKEDNPRNSSGATKVDNPRNSSGATKEENPRNSSGASKVDNPRNNYGASKDNNPRNNCEVEVAKKDNPRNGSAAVKVDNSRYSFGVGEEDNPRNGSGATKEDNPRNSSGATKEDNPRNSSGATKEENPRNSSGASKVDNPRNSSGASKADNPRNSSGASKEDNPRNNSEASKDNNPRNSSGASKEDNPRNNCEVEVAKKDNPRNSSAAVKVDSSRYSFGVGEEDNPKNSSGAFESAKLKKSEEFELLKHSLLEMKEQHLKKTEELETKFKILSNASTDSYSQLNGLFSEVLVQTLAQRELQNEKQRKQREIADVRGRTSHLLEQFPEIVKVDLSILWKITMFHQKMTNALAETEVLVCSQPFYLEGLHYRAHLQLYPNGNGAGKGSHMSLFLVIMKGEFDEDLSWPFVPKVTFKLIDQTGDKDIIKNFQPNPIKKPELDRNDGCGYLRFVSHADLKNGGFIEDDTLLIQCEVHPAN